MTYLPPIPRPVYLVEEVGDGDTFTALVDSQMDVLRRVRIRVSIVNAPERKDREGWLLARLFTHDWLLEHQGGVWVGLHLTSSGRLLETFGRIVADVYHPASGRSLSSDMLEAGVAVPYARALHPVAWQLGREDMPLD